MFSKNCENNERSVKSNAILWFYTARSLPTFATLNRNTIAVSCLPPRRGVEHGGFRRRTARFFYVHPLEWYLRLDEPKDTLEWFNGDLDYSGWDLRKALRLFAACNPSMNEQLDSPIVYESKGDFSGQIREPIPVYFNPIKAMHHDLGIAANFTEPVFLNEQVGIKKLFYILRPLLAGQWIAQFQSMPPTEFSRLFDETNIDTALRSLIDHLLVQKESAAEQAKIAVAPPLADWIRTTCERLPKETERFPRREKPGWEPLHRLFHEIVILTNN